MYKLKFLKNMISFVFVLTFALSAESLFATKNASVFLYGQANDGEYKVLFAKTNKGWVLPGGGIKLGQSSVAAAASELFEETAAYPQFDITKTTASIQNAPKYTWHGHTDIYMVDLQDLGLSIDGLVRNITTGYQGRIQGKPRDFHEVTEWISVPFKNLRYYLNNNLPTLNVYKQDLNVVDFVKKSLKDMHGQTKILNK